MRITAMRKLGLIEFLDPEKRWTKYDTQQFASRARSAKKQIKELLNYTVSDKVSDTQIVHELLDRLIGVKVKQVYWSNNVAGHEGEKLRVYQLDPDCWKFLTDLLSRRHSQVVVTIPKDGSPPLLLVNIQRGGDPPGKEPVVSSLIAAHNPSEFKYEERQWQNSAA